MKTVLLAQPIHEAGMKALEGKVKVIVSPDPSSETVGGLLQAADGLIVRTATRVTRDMLENALRLQVVSRTGGGLDNVDVDAATQCGVLVCGVKGPQDRFVAEHAVALMLALAKDLPYLDRQTRAGNFRSRFEYRPQGLSGKLIGLIGLGRIGRIVGRICGQALAMEVWGYDPYVPARDMEEAGVRPCESLETLLAEADVVSVHVPLTPQTRGLIGPEQIGLMKPGAFIINTSRGEMIQEAALAEALRAGRLAGAGLDVFEHEPPPPENPLFALQNVIVTPHSAALTREAVAQLAEGAARNVLAVLEGGCPTYCPNWAAVRG